MANTYVTPKAIAKEALRLLVNNLVFAKNLDRRYDKEFNGQRKIGDTITVKKAARFTVREGKVVSLNDYTERSVDVKINKQLGVDVAFDSAQLALNLDDFSKQVLKPQMATLANYIDALGMKEYFKIPNAVGTPGSTAMDLDVFIDAGVKLDNEAAPSDGERGMILNPKSQGKAVKANKDLFNSQPELKNQYEKGRMGTAAGFDFAMSQNVPVHIVGPQGGTPLVNGAAQTGLTLATDGWTAAAGRRLNKGDIFTIAGVYGVNPMSKDTTGELRQFTVTADFDSSGTGTGNIAIYPALVGPGDKEQTVTALPADNAAITVMGTAGTPTAVNMGYHPDAFVMVTAALPLPKGMDMAEVVSAPSVGLSLRLIRGYDVMTDNWVSRIDILLGFETVYPELAVRVQA